MRQLLLLRHAKSAQGDPAQPDYARPLNMRGRDAASAMARAMRGLSLAPELVLVSSARRTLQTLEAFEPWGKMPAVQTLDALYLASEDELLDIVRAAPAATTSVMVIGHNPGLHELALMLAGDAIADAESTARWMGDGFPSGSLAEFSVSCPWPELRAGATRLTRFMAPADLSEVNA